MTGTIPQETIEPIVKTRIVLKKYAGDGPADRTDEPIETIVIEDGEVVESH